jgi:hypothetical protein
VVFIRRRRRKMRDSAGRACQLDGDGTAPDLRHRQRPRGRADDDQGQNKALTKVARFFWVQYTKAGENLPNDYKITKCP